MKTVISTFIKQLLFLCQYIIYELTYYVIGGEAILQDLINRPYNKCEIAPRTGSVAVVTGGARGIGACVVKKLLQCDMHVIICCRNTDAGKNVVAKIRKGGVYTGEATVYELDLCSLGSIKSCAAQIHKNFSYVNILVNNAGIMFPPYTETKEGFESQWGVNYVGPFLLTHLLTPLMEKVPGSIRGRVVNVTSCAHIAAKPIEFDNINMKNYFITSKAYAQSKLAQILFTIYLDKLLREKNSRTHVLSVHPGVVNTDIFEGTALKTLFPWVLQYLCKTVDEGATSVLYACISTDLEEKGGLYLTNCLVKPPSKLSQDQSLQNSLFNYTTKILNISEFGNPQI